jgi:hypothetical protein
MNRLFDHAGERLQFLHAALWAFVACTGFGIMVAYYLVTQDRIGLGGAIAIVLGAWLLAAMIAIGAWKFSGVAGRSFVRTVTGAGDLPPTRGFSYQESLVARGQYQEAAQAYRDHLRGSPEDFPARLGLAAVLRDHLGLLEEAAAELVQARRRHPPRIIEFAIGNALIDIHARQGDRGRELSELARFAERFQGTPEGTRAREAITRIKREGSGAWKYFRTREVAEARAWAMAGGIAVHENIWKSRGRRTCHLLARSEQELLVAARSVGCHDAWIQRTRTVHFDLVEVYLDRALIRCGSRLP